MTSDFDLELALKCLNHLVFSSEKTKRSLTPCGNPPDAAKSWKAGHLVETFAKLGIKVKDYPESSTQQTSSQGASKSNANGSQELRLNNERSSRRNADESVERAGLVPSKSTILRNRLAGISTFNPPRRISPPRSQSPVSVNPPQSFSQRREDQRVYPPPSSSSSLSLYDTYEDKKWQRSFPSKVVSFPKEVPSLSNGNKRNLEPTENVEERKEHQESAFRTAHQQLLINDRAKGIKRTLAPSGANVHVSGLRKTPRYDPPPPPPAVENNQKEEPISDNPEVVELMQNPLMKNIDPKMVEAVLNEVLDAGSVDWGDIAGLENVKNIIKEIVLKPMLRPDIFTGIRAPPKGILLFGPPGTGKTMIGRLIATRSKFSFFNISASSLTSKWIGDGEKMVRALFAVARAKQPAVVFIDEIDSILTQRSETEHESSRRLKTEFLIQFDGCGSKSEDRILIIGVTNRPRELDDAARRRFVKRIYIPLPDAEGRKQLVKNLIRGQNNCLAEEEYEKIASITEGYSGADMATLCQEAAYSPIRDVDVDIENISLEDVRPINLADFETGIELVKPSVDPSDLTMYEEFDRQFGCQAVKPKTS